MSTDKHSTMVLYPRTNSDMMLLLSVGQGQRCGGFIPLDGVSRPSSGLLVELLSHIFEFGIQGSLQEDTQGFKTNKGCDESCCIWLRTMDDSGVVTEKEVQKTGSPGNARLLLSFPIVVSHVCRRWRSAAISTASLWTRIDVSPDSRPPYSRVATFLERSKSLPIDIRIRIRCPKHGRHSNLKLESIPSPSLADLALLYSLLLMHVHRWRSIDSKAMSYEQTYAFLDAISDPAITTASQLVSLVLSANSADDSDKDFQSLIVAKNFSPFNGSAPNLTRVRLDGVLVDWNQSWMSHGSRLTTLELLQHPGELKVSPSWNEFKAILRGAPALERLVLHMSGPPGDPPNLVVHPDLGVVVAPDPDPVPLLRLTHLSLLFQTQTCVYGLLRTLYMPALKSLSTDVLWGDYTEFLWYVTAPATVPSAVLSANAGRAPRSLLRDLETLDLLCALCPPGVIEVLYDELEHVTSLRVSMNELWGPMYGCAFVLPLLPRVPAMVAGDAADMQDEEAQARAEAKTKTKTEAEAEAENVGHLKLPRLETLSVSDVSGDVHWRVIRDVVWQRGVAGRPIKSLYVESWYDVREEDGVWFAENVDTFVFSKRSVKL